MLDISCDSAALGVHQDAAVRFCQSAIESAERDQEMHIQTVMNNKQQQAGLDIASNRSFFLKMKLVKKNPRQFFPRRDSWNGWAGWDVHVDLQHAATRSRSSCHRQHYLHRVWTALRSPRDPCVLRGRVFSVNKMSAVTLTGCWALDVKARHWMWKQKMPGHFSSSWMSQVRFECCESFK